MEPIHKLIRIIHYKNWGFEIKHEEIKMNKKEPAFLIWSAFTLGGDYIGDPKMAWRICQKRGIKPEKADSSHSVCSIGYSKKVGKWFGWSHRAICGFKIGDVVKKGDCTASSAWTPEYLKKHPKENKSLSIGFKAKTLKDCRKMAIAFAESVS